MTLPTPSPSQGLVLVLDLLGFWAKKESPDPPGIFLFRQFFGGDTRILEHEHDDEHEHEHESPNFGI